MAEQPALGFGGLLRQLRAEALLTQEELAEAAKLSPRSVSNIERGLNRTARKDTAVLLAEALGLAEPARGLFVAVAVGRGRAEDVLAARDGGTPGTGHRPVRWARGCPYRGLLPFGESDTEVFYGRERLAAELTAKLAARAAGGGLVVVTGASGSGKSSLLRAGLVPILAGGQQVPGSDRWARIVMTPTRDPLSELAARLAAVSGADAVAVRDGLARHPEQARLAVRAAVLAAALRRDAELPVSGDGAVRLVLLVDQFEQVFTLNPDPGGERARQGFITALCSAAANPAGPEQGPAALVVIAVRGDFWDRCAAVPELVGPLQDGQFVVGPMTESELRVAITGPAEAAGLRIDPALTDLILGDLRVASRDRSAGVLPLLSQAMALTWEHREGDRLTSHGYAQAGGVSHAVQTAADRAYDALTAGQQALAPDVLRSMTVASRDGGLARRPVTRDELYDGLPGAARGDIDAVLDAFAAERLAILDGDRAQLSHDVLLRAWPRLYGWLEQDQASWIVHGQLADAAAAWRDSREDPSFLYRGGQLAALGQAVARWSANPARSPALTGTQRGFLQASERAAARSIRRRQGGFVILALLTALAVAAAGFAFSQRAAAISQRAAAIRQRDQAVYNQVIAEALQFGTSDTTLAAQLNLAAWHIQPTPDLVSRLLNTENTPLASPLAIKAGSASTVTFSQKGHMLASGSADGTIRLWDVTDPAHPRPLGQPLTVSGVDIGAGIGSVALSPDARMLAGVDDLGTVQLWDVADPAHPRPLGRPQTSNEFVDLVAFSPDGYTLASASSPASGSGGSTVQLWDIADPAHPRLVGQPQAGNEFANSLAFSPDGHMLAGGGNPASGGGVQLWDVADPAHPRPLGRPLTGGVSASVTTVAFSPDGHTLASIDALGRMLLWDITDPAHPSPLGQPLIAGGASAVDSVAFSPDGHTLTSGSADGTIRLWDVADPAHPRPLGQPLTAGGVSAVDSVAFSPDGHTLASLSGDGTVRLWSLPQTVLTGGSASVITVTFSPDGHTLASIDALDAARLWDVADPAHPRPLGQTFGSAPVSLVAFSPRGHILAGIGAMGAARLWDVADPARPRPLGQPLFTGDGSGVSAAFSPDGHTMASAISSASGGGGSTVQLWDVTDPAHPHPLGQPLFTGGGSGESVAFSPDGHTLASSSIESTGPSSTIQLWDVTDPAHPRPLGQPQTSNEFVNSLAFSPDGHTLASASGPANGSGGSTVQLWDVTDPAHARPLGQPQTSNEFVNSLAFSPDGHTLASSDYGGTVQLWDVTDPAHPRPLGQPPTGGASAVDSVAFSPDGYTLATGSLDGTIRLWNLNVQYAIQRICATAGGLTPRQWNQYIPHLRYQASCGY